MSEVVGDAAQRVLRELGLTAYESTVYLGLITHGVMTASEVSESTNVPFSKVYEVLNNLDRKGWVNIERGRPHRYFPQSPAEAFAASRRELNEKYERWEQTITGELQPLYEQRELREKPDLWILRGKASILAKLQEMVSQTRSKVMIAIPVFARTLAKEATPMLSRLKLKPVKLLIMVAGDPNKWELQRLMTLAEVRRRDQLFGGGIIVDGKEAMLFLGEEKAPSLVVWSNHVGLVKFAEDYFQYLWESSRKP